MGVPAPAPAARATPNRGRLAPPACSGSSPAPPRTGRGASSSTPEIDELRAVIDGLWEAHVALERMNIRCPWVFQHRSWDRAAKVRRHGQRIRCFRRAWVTACIAAGCPGRVPHDFRRTAVRNLIRAGVQQAIAMKITGHKTDSIFRRYLIVDEELLAQATGAVAELLDEARRELEPS